MSEVPRKPPLTPTGRAKTIATTHAALSGAGQTKAARPVRNNTRQAHTYVPPARGVASRDRLTLVWSTFDIVADAGVIPTWGGYGSAALDQSGDSIQLSDPSTDDGRVYLFGEGLYCVTVQINAAVGSASSDQVVAASARINDRPSALGIAAVLRGGDPVGQFAEYHATGTTFYSAGAGLSGGGIKFAVECSTATVSADIGQVTVRVAVQKVAGF